MQDWVSKEDAFVLKQSKKKAQIRVREGRAKPIDWLAVILSIIDPTKEELEDQRLEEDAPDADVEVMDPEGVVEELNLAGLNEVEKGIDSYLALETNKSNHNYWNVSYQRTT